MLIELVAVGMVFASVLTFGIWFTVKNYRNFHLRFASAGIYVILYIVKATTQEQNGDGKK